MTVTSRDRRRQRRNARRNARASAGLLGRGERARWNVDTGSSDAPVVAAVAVLAVLAGAGALVLPALVPSADAAPGSRQELTFADPAIDESSGLVVRGSDVLTVNDSGDGAVVYVVDAATGATVGRTTYTTDEVVDVEALAAGRNGTVWVGDIGDNDRARPVVSLYRLPAVTRGDRTVSAQRFDLVHPDGPRDAEALLVQPSTGRVFVVTKGVFGGQVLAAPRTLRTDRPNRLRPVGTVGGLVTDGTFLPGGAVALRDYADGFVLDPRTWRTVGSFRLPSQQQAEAIAPWPQRRVLVSSEGETQPLYSAPVPPRLLRLASPSVDRAGEVGAGADGGKAGDGPGADDGSGRVDGSVDGRRDARGPRTDRDEPAQPFIPVGPAVAGGGALALATLTGFWLLRRRVRR
jgi:hypothetical protein